MYCKKVVKGKIIEENAHVVSENSCKKLLVKKYGLKNGEIPGLWITRLAIF